MKTISLLTAITALTFAALACALPIPPTTVTPKPTATALVKCDISKIKITLAKQDNGKAIALKISESFSDPFFCAKQSLGKRMRLPGRAKTAQMLTRYNVQIA